MSVVLKGRARDEYNKTRYSAQWLSSSEHRLSSDYYRRDHNQDTLGLLVRSSGTRVLECGIGTGEFFALGLAAAGKEVYGIDFSSELLADCRSRFLAKGKDVRVALGDVQALPLAGEYFDATYAIGVMPYMHDLKGAIGEMLRVTKRGGIVVFDMMNAWHCSQEINYWYRVFEGSGIGFRFIHLLKRAKESIGLKTHYKTVPEKVNYRLISPVRMMMALRSLGVRYEVRGYNVLLPLDMPIIGKKGNLCERFRLFSCGLKDAPVIRYFGAKLVFVIHK